tara:strand:- start:192 stop:539 length:348 start_codon:yes stop_codon:yes gene_type:complete
MGRKITPVPTVSGTVKSIQHISTTIYESGTDADVSITAVSNTNKAYIVNSSQSANHYGGFEYSNRDVSSGNSSAPDVFFTSTSNVRVHTDELDVFGGYSYGTVQGAFYGSVIEVT